MSAYVEIATPLLDRECLVQALKEMGFSDHDIRVSDTPMNLQGYRGDLRNNIANIIIQRSAVGASSNDIGFLETPMGYRIIVSEFDRARFNNSWVQKLSHNYNSAYSEKMKRLAEMEEKKREEERIRLEELKRQAREEINRTIQEKAIARGYVIKEERNGKTINLVLVKRSY